MISGFIKNNPILIFIGYMVFCVAFCRFSCWAVDKLQERFG
jgi:hypothetical protein